MEHEISGVIGAIYDCVADEDLWPQALRLIGNQVDGFLTTVAVFDTTTQTARLAQVACDDSRAIEVLMQYAREVPFYHLLHLMEIDQPGPLERMFALYGSDGEKVWKEGGLYRNLHSRFGVHNSIDMAVLKRPTRIGTINISVKYAEISRDRLDLVGLLGPHIRRSLTIQDMLEMERAETRIFRDILEGLEHGVVIVSDAMEVLYANAAAERHIREKAVVSVTGGRLVAPFPVAQTALTRAVSLGVADEVSLGGSGIDVPLGTTSRPAVAHVMPLARRSIRNRIETRAAAAIFIAAAGTVIQTAIEAIAALFALTSAEKRVANYVSEGMTRHEIAQAQGVTEGTVKSQLSAIYDKTGTSDQRSLQSLMMELSPPVSRSRSEPAARSGARKQNCLP
jgi:DNA-binding CsgD family transcriptional regulator/PAS domain-containing protein